MRTSITWILWCTFFLSCNDSLLKRKSKVKEHPFSQFEYRWISSLDKSYWEREKACGVMVVDSQFISLYFIRKYDEQLPLEQISRKYRAVYHDTISGALFDSLNTLTKRHYSHCLKTINYNTRWSDSVRRYMIVYRPQYRKKYPIPYHYKEIDKCVLFTRMVHLEEELLDTVYNRWYKKQ